MKMVANLSLTNMRTSRYSGKYILIFVYFVLHISFVCLNGGQVYSQSGWVLQSPYPQSHALFSSKFLDSSNGYAVGQIGTVIKTTNGGINWTVKNLDSLKTFYSCSFININTGFVCGQSGSLYKTINGGNNWNKLISGINNIDFNTVYMVNNSIIYIGSDSGRIIKSTDGGINFVIQQAPTLGSITQLFFINEQLGFGSVYNGKVIKTTDGGQTWTYIQLTPYYLNSVYFITPLIGYAVGGTFNPLIFKTTDGGNNWFSQYPPSSSQYLNSIYFSDTNTGIAVGRGGTIFYTSNGGNSWLDATQYYLTTNDLFSIVLFNSGIAYAVGDGGNILKSVNAGTNWVSIFSGTISNIHSIFFLDKYTGYACSDANDNTGQNVLMTTNGGEYWFKQIVPYADNINSIYFINYNIGFVSSANGYIFKTTNSGTNWTYIQGTYINASLYGITFTDTLTGYVVGNGGIYKTTNQGINWLIKNNTIGYSVKFLNAETGYVSSSLGQILKTTNSGINWITQNSGVINDLYSIFFVNENTGYVCGGFNSVILKTVNAGSTWTNIFNGTGYNLHSIYFVNNNTGYSVGGYSTQYSYVLKTTNSGVNWYSLNSGVNSQLNNILFINDTVGYAVGNWGIILKTTDGGGQPIGIRKIYSKVPSENQLFQNFPNPFNSTTKIHFRINKIYELKIIIYDILGRLIDIIINGKYEPGEYELNWNPQYLSSGVYIYCLKINENIISKK